MKTMKRDKETDVKKGKRQKFVKVVLRAEPDGNFNATFMSHPLFHMNTAGIGYVPKSLPFFPGQILLRESREKGFHTLSRSSNHFLFFPSFPSFHYANFPGKKDFSICRQNNKKKERRGRDFMSIRSLSRSRILAFGDGTTAGFLPVCSP